MKNYGLSALDISFKNYMICSMLGSLVFVPLKAYVGHQFIDVYEQSKQGKVPTPSIALVITLLSVFSMAAVVKKIVSVTVKDEKKEKEE